MSIFVTAFCPLSVLFDFSKRRMDNGGEWNAQKHVIEDYEIIF